MLWNNAIASPTIFVIGAADQENLRLYELYAESYAQALQINSSIVLVDVSSGLLWPYKGLTYCEPFSIDGDPVYCIRINGQLDHRKKLKAMAHEMIHAQQYNHGLLQRLGSLIYRWKDEKTYNLAWVGYHFRPWEKDAFDRDTNLYVRTRRAVKKLMKRQP